MKLRVIHGVRIAGVTAALPTTVLGEDFFAALYGAREARRVALGTGIRQIRVADGQSTADMMAAAAVHLMHGLAIESAAIDGLITITQTPDAWSPGASYVLHHELSLQQDCYLLDINAGCSGYVSGLVQAAALVRSGACKNVLLCTGDINTRLTADDAHQVRMLFGDAASASLVTTGDQAISYMVGSDGSGSKRLGVEINYAKGTSESAHVGYLAMDGAAVMSFALRRVPEVTRNLLSSLNISKHDVDYFILHQPNELMLSYLRDAMDVADEKFLVDVASVGNTNSTSIPLVIARRINDRPDTPTNVVLSGFGVGLSWNALHVDLSATQIFAPVACPPNAVPGEIAPAN